MADTLDPRHTDKRTAERYLRNGDLDEKAYERYLKSLPDVAEKGVPLETVMDDDIDDYDDEDEDEEEEEGDEDAAGEGTEGGQTE